MDTCFASAYEAFWEEFLALRVGVWEMTSGLSPYSPLRLVRQLLHAVRQSARLSGRISHIST